MGNLSVWAGSRHRGFASHRRDKQRRRPLSGAQWPIHDHLLRQRRLAVHGAAAPRIRGAQSLAIYATGGLALTQLRTDFSFVDSAGALEFGANTLKAGYAAGGGIEAPLTGQLSIKAEYLHLAFANSAGVQTASNLPGQSFFHAGDLKTDIVRVGLNYRFDVPGSPSNSNPAVMFKAPPMRVEPPLFNDWQIEAGTRLWFSTGTVGAPQPLIDIPTLAGTLGHWRRSWRHGWSTASSMRYPAKHSRASITAADFLSKALSAPAASAAAISTTRIFRPASLIPTHCRTHRAISLTAPSMPATAFSGRLERGLALSSAIITTGRRSTHTAAISSPAPTSARRHCRRVCSR